MNQTHSQAPTRCGFVAIVGLPNAGKSTLTNALVGEKVAIATPKAQTTRLPLRAVHTDAERGIQTVFVDTPGLFTPKGALENTLVEGAEASWRDADAVLLLLDATKGFTEFHQTLCGRIQKTKKPLFLGLNKIDLVKPKEKLLSLMQEATEMGCFEKVIPMSALKADNTVLLLEALESFLPESPFLYDTQQVTDSPFAARAAEITREKAMVLLQQEVPYGVAVQAVHSSQRDDGTYEFHQNLIVGMQRHKAMVIGKNGAMLKKIGSAARRDLGKLIGARAHLFLNVKVQERWYDMPAKIAHLVRG